MAFLVIGSPLLYTSCSKESSTIDNPQTKDNKISINIKGIKNSPEFKSSQKEQNYTLKSFSDVDVALAVTELNTSETLKLKNTEGLEPLANNVKYTIYIYDGTNLVIAKTFTAQEVGTIEGLDASKTYTWVAASHNNETDAPSLTPTTGGVSIPQNTDFLYSSGTLDISSNPTINVEFSHALSRIGIEINTIGVFGDISETPPSLTVSGLNLKAGSIDLATGTITASNTTYDPSLSYSDFENVEEGFNDAKIAYVYTAGTDALNIQINLQNLKINHYDGGLERTYFSANTPFTLNITPEIGKSQKALLNVVESALSTNHENVAVNWGRSNLYYRGDLGARSYAFLSTNRQTSRANTYFSYKGKVAGQFPSTETQGDPCLDVYPAGLWKTPSQAQVSSISTSTGALSGLLTSIGQLLGAADPAPGSSPHSESGVDYAKYTIATVPTSNNAFGTPTSSSNELRFYYNGQITNTTVLTAVGSNGNGLLGLGLSNLSVDLLNFQLLNTTIPVLGTSFNSQTALWTDSDYLSGPLLEVLGTSVGSHGYLAYTTQRAVAGIPVGSEFVKATTSVEALSNIDLLGVNLLNTSFKNVRCVRASAI